MAEEAVSSPSDAAITSNPAPASAPLTLPSEPLLKPDSNDALSTELHQVAYKASPSQESPLDGQFPDTIATTPSDISTDIVPGSILIRSKSEHFHATRSQTMPPPSIQFAPLPELEPRRRNTSLQLGVAARSRMLRNRRMMMAQGAYDTSECEVNGSTQYVIRGNQMSVWEEHRDPGLGDDAVEEAFIALARMVKGAGKTLWRKVSHREIRRNAPHEGENELGENGLGEKGEDEQDSNPGEKKGKKSKSRHGSTTTKQAKVSSSATSAAVASTPAETQPPVPPLPVGILKRDNNDSENLTVRLTIKEPRQHLYGHDEMDTEMGGIEQGVDGGRLGGEEEEKGGVWEEEVGENLRRRLSGVPTRDEISYQPPELPKADVVQTTVISVCTSTVEPGGNGSRKSKPKGPKVGSPGSS